MKKRIKNKQFYPIQHVSSGEERRAHNPEDPGSKPGHAIHIIQRKGKKRRKIFCLSINQVIIYTNVTVTILHSSSFLSRLAIVMRTKD